MLYASHFGSRSGLARHFRVGRVFLVGDAAHVHPPAGGQGMNTAVQDAYNLGWKLGQVLRHGASDALLDSYEEERLPVAAHLLEFVVQMHKDWLGKAKDKEEPRKGEHMQLSLNYRGGPLSLDERGGGGRGRDAGGRPRAGRAAGDARGAAGAAVRRVSRRRISRCWRWAAPSLRRSTRIPATPSVRHRVAPAGGGRRTTAR